MNNKELNSISDWVRELSPEQKRRVYLVIISLALVWITMTWSIALVTPKVWNTRKIEGGCPGYVVPTELIIEIGKQPETAVVSTQICRLTYGYTLNAKDIENRIKKFGITDKVKVLTPGTKLASKLDWVDSNIYRLRGVFVTEDRAVVYSNKWIDRRIFVYHHNGTYYIGFVPPNE